MTYYLKRLGFQELGSVSSTTGVPSRGRYIYISKDYKVLSTFPPLSKRVFNDITLLPIIPLYNNKIVKSYCSLVYHNDKYHGSTAKSPRNEYRLYLNTSLENGKLLFEKDDILVLKSDIIEEEVEGTMKRQSVYYLDLIKDKTSNTYSFLNNLIDESNVSGAHAIYNGSLEFFESKVKKLKSKGTDIEQRVDETVTKQLERGSKEYLAQLFNSTNFRDFVMVGYQELCAVSRTVIRSNRFLNLEAAHIKPNSHGGLFLPNNGLALSRDLHWAFDKGLFTIKDDYTVNVHDEVSSDLLQGYHGEKIYLPKDDFFKPDLENLKYHQDNVYGLFLTSGRL